MGVETPDRREWLRKTQFVVIGSTGMALSYLLLWVGTHLLQLSAPLAFFIQTLLVLEFNFFASHAFTWGDRHGTLSGRWTRFHASRLLLLMPANQLLFWFLHVPVGPMIANTICVGTSTAFNWIVNDKWVFAHRPHTAN